MDRRTTVGAHKHTSTQAHKHTSTQAHKHTSTQAHKHTSTQFVQRLLNFASDYRIKVRLAYYPPYHSKYNAVERCWGILENHWNGALLDTIEAVIGYGGTMTWKGRRPVVELVTTSYAGGITLSKEAMKAVEGQLTRHLTLGNGRREEGFLVADCFTRKLSAPLQEHLRQVTQAQFIAESRQDDQ